jgi:hypothetical protein
MENSVEVFERDRYVVLPALLKEPSLTQHYRYVCRVGELGLLMSGDEQVPGAPCAFGDFMMDHLLMRILPEIERASGLTLQPTYSYLRVYKRGDILGRHTDRPACEISVTLCLGSEGEKSWPIWIEGPGGTSATILTVGDALLYRGTECPHWREAFEGERHTQVFLHYVDKNGPHTAWKFDKRKSLTEFAREPRA